MEKFDDAQSLMTTVTVYCLPPESQMRSNCRFMHTFERSFLSIQIQRHGPIIWVKPNWILFDIQWNTQFYWSTSPSQTRFMEFNFVTTAIFIEICGCSSLKRCTSTWVFWLCWRNSCSHLYTVLKWKSGLQGYTV